MYVEKAPRIICEVVERLGNEPVDLLEINVSCPNVKEGGIAFGQDPKALEAITKEVKKYAKQPIIMKLSPNVTDITEMAKAAEAGGADILSLINTLTGMKIDINRRTFALANKTGGMSGPAVKPDRSPHGLSGGAGCFSSDHRNGRNRNSRGCTGIYHGRCDSSICGNCKLLQSVCDC